MPTFWEKMKEDYAARRAAKSRPKPAALPAPTTNSKTDIYNSKNDPQPPGGFSYGTQIYGGPLFSDAFQSRRAPSPWQLVEKFKTLVYAMAQRNIAAVSRVPIRLYADGSRVMGKPRRNCDPIKVSRSIGRKMAEAGLVSSAAVDQVYEIRNHDILETLDDPDRMGYFDREKIIGLMVAYMDVVGQAFLVPEGNGWDWRNPNRTVKKGPPEYLWVLYPQFIVPFRDAGDSLIRYWQYFRDQIAFEDALWFRHSISLRDAYGSAYSPTYASDIYSDQEDRFCAIWDQLLGLGPRPNVVASAKDPDRPPGEPERRRLEQDFGRQQTGGNAGGLWINTGAWEFTPISYSPADLAAKEINEYNLYRMASIFGQPPTYYTVDSNLANLQAADQQHARMGVEPRCRTISSKFTHLVRSWDKRLFMRFDPVLPEDDEVKARIVDMNIRNGRVTINQANEEEKYPSVEWGDEPWMPNNLVQPSMAREQHEQGLAQQKAAMDSQKRQDDFELREPEEGEDIEQPAQIDNASAAEARSLANEQVTRERERLLDRVRRMKEQVERRLAS